MNCFLFHTPSLTSQFIEPMYVFDVRDLLHMNCISKGAALGNKIKLKIVLRI